MTAAELDELEGRIRVALDLQCTTTRSEAWALGDGSVVVLVVGRTGGVHLSHIEVSDG